MPSNVITAWRLRPGLASIAIPKTKATTEAAAPSHRSRASGLSESEAASATASTTLAAPAAYNRVNCEIVGHASTSVPTTAEAVIVANRAARSDAVGTPDELDCLEDSVRHQSDAEDDPDRPQRGSP